MIKKIFFLIVLLASLIITDKSTFAAESPFQISAKSTFELTWNGENIATDSLLNVRDESDIAPPDPLRNPEGYRHQNIDGKDIQNIWRISNPHEDITYRREVANDENSVEITTQFRVPAYYFDDKPKSLQAFYKLTIPLKPLAGAKYKAVINGNGKTVEGVIMPGEKPTLGTRVYYITFEDKNGQHLSFDFGPTGSTSFDQTSATGLVESWWGGSDENEMRFSVGRLQANEYPHNGVYNAKVIIDKSTFEQWQKRHAHHTYRYFMELPPIYQFSFGAGQLGKKWLQTNHDEIPEKEALARENDKWIPAAKQEYGTSNNFGWKDAKRIDLSGDISQGVLEGAAKSTFPAEFNIKVGRPGIYIFTVRAKAQNDAIGPFSISSNGKNAAENIRLNPKEIKTITFARYVKDGVADISLSGNWAISTIAVQRLIDEFEDFTFERGVWLAQDIPTPTTLYLQKFAPFSDAASVQQLAPAESAKMNDRAKIPQQIDFTKDEENPSLDWRWSSNIAALGPGLKGSFYEFETEEEISRRLDELQKLGYTTILMNGLHIRYAWPDQMDRVRKTMARIVEIAHQRGMKVIDHSGVTILPNKNATFKLMLDNLDWTLRDVRNGQITRGFNVNNPDFQDYYIAQMKEHVKATGIDGFMLDEVSLQTNLYSGDEYSRAKFHQDTGLTLPTNEHDPDFFNPDSRLWRQWLLWRTQAITDFKLRLMQQMREINPDFIWIKYAAPSIFMKKDGLWRWSGRTSEASRYSNFQGIESLTDNVYANFRSKFAIANIFNSYVRKDDIPAFDLIYPQGEPVFAYAGWALNNMTRHRTWSTSKYAEITKDAQRYVDWKDNMNLRNARQIADVAVLLSRSTRDFSPQANRFAENENLKGVVQGLGDLHIQYQVILDRDLSVDELQKYRLLILPSTSAMSDAELKIIREYIENGGYVLAMYKVGMQDELGTARPKWVLGQWLNLATRRSTRTGSTLSGKLLGDEKSTFGGATMSAFTAKNTTGKVLLSAQNKEENSVAVIEQNIGKGSLIWSAVSIGPPNFEPYGKSGTTWKYKANETALNLLQRLVNVSLHDEKQTFEAVQIPRGVLTTAYYAKGENDKIDTFIHLYNGTGAGIKKGDKIPNKPPQNAFPKLSKDVIFEINLPDKSTFTADVVSPDYEGSRKVTLQSLGNSRYRVIVPKENLEAYSMVRIRQN